MQLLSRTVATGIGQRKGNLTAKSIKPFSGGRLQGKLYKIRIEKAVFYFKLFLILSLIFRRRFP